MAIGGTLLELISKQVPSDQARNLTIFAERLFARLPRSIGEHLSAEESLQIARDAFDSFSSRKDPVAMRILSRRGKDRALTTVEIGMPDSPFIIDSIREYFRQIDFPIRLLLHPIFSISRDGEGQLTSFETAAASERRESFIHIETEPCLSDRSAGELAAELERRLRQVLQVTSDFEAMTARALKICDELAAVRSLIEVRDFLRWLVQGGFVFLGYRHYTVATEDGRHLMTTEAGSGLGIFRDELRSRFAAPQSLEDLDPTLKKQLIEGPVLLVSKTRSESVVHRLARMDDVILRRVDSRGRLTGFDRFVGLFTSKAYAEEAQHIPILRAKLKQVIEAEGATPGSHDYKELISLFNSFPKEELFRASVEELRAQLAVILDSQASEDIRVNLQFDANRGMAIVLVVMPRERFSSEVRVRIQDAVARQLGGDLIYYFLAMSEGYTARLHFCFSASKISPDTVKALEREVMLLARGWEDRLQDELVSKFGEARGYSLAARYARAFSADYKASTEISRAVADIEHIEAMLQGDPETVEMAPVATEDGRASTELRVYDLGQPLVLSDVMPLLQNFGIRVLSEDAHELKFETEGKLQSAFVQTFSVQDSAGRAIEATRAATLAEALTAVRRGRAESDPLNALTLSGGLSWREVSVLRAYLATAFQMRLGPARPALRRVFLSYPKLARNLIELFATRLDPNAEPAADEFEKLKGAYLEQLGAVDNLTDDRIARALLNMVEATTRTNFFQPIPEPDPYIALKFESGKIANLLDVAPLYEIHVNSPRMEGCHLRAGKIARGGIRASDRFDDYRTEILGLMKTQTVKNAIIVPVGAKGGFIVKPGSEQATSPEKVVAAYKTLINAMLDLTDNLVEGRQVHPSNTRVLDDDGPYLVVAADKGTATFSDLANEIAEQRGFWTGDAFASGGKHGYDHKALGITARGAWESVKRHLREMGREVDTGPPITVVGIGDMSGDVFGNGLLQSSNLKLLAAFNHKHIFLDPDPDPALSFAERKRLYELTGSQWSDYYRSLISAGGNVFPRGQKRIVLTPEVQQALKTTEKELDGESLVRVILKADVDLLYNGGIGTYVRATNETDAQVGDHANDACRITAPELRVKMVAEGGNLGFTQMARIEYALNGGRINTDAIDNSAGVDMSDHEVNLKLLLQRPRARNEITLEERNQDLEQATQEVVSQVLSDNRDQVLLLSIEQLRSRTQATTFRDHLTAIEERGLLRRSEEALPTREALRARRSRYPGLTRPELAVLMAYTKLDLTRLLQTSDLINQPYLVERFLRPYFPASIAGRFAGEIPAHPLKREIIATKLVNEMVDLMGSIFVFGLVRDYGVATDKAVRAWIIVDNLLDLAERSEKLKGAARTIPVGAELESFLALERAATNASRWALSEVEPQLSIVEVFSRFKQPFLKLSGEFESYLVGPERERFERAYRDLKTAGEGEEVAHDLARLAFADHLLNVLSVAERSGAAPELAAEVYFQIVEVMDFSSLESTIEAVPSEDRWERRAARQLAIDLREIRNRITRRVLSDCPDGDSKAAVDRVRQAREREFSEAQYLLSEIRALPTISIAALQVAVRSLSQLA